MEILDYKEMVKTTVNTENKTVKLNSGEELRFVFLDTNDIEKAKSYMISTILQKLYQIKILPKYITISQIGIYVLLPISPDLVLEKLDFDVLDEKEIRSILFQLIFYIFIGNSYFGIRYGTAINRIRVGVLSVPKTLKYQIKTNELRENYDTFEIETSHVLVPTGAYDARDYLETDFDKNDIHYLINTFNVWPKEFVEDAINWGFGLPEALASWGPELALYHPLFKDYYKGESGRLSDLHGLATEHGSLWGNIEQKYRDIRIKVVDQEIEKKFGSIYNLKPEGVKLRDDIINLVKETLISRSLGELSDTDDSNSEYIGVQNYNELLKQLEQAGSKLKFGNLDILPFIEKGKLYAQELSRDNDIKDRKYIFYGYLAVLIAIWSRIYENKEFTLPEDMIENNRPTGKRKSNVLTFLLSFAKESWQSILQKYINNYTRELQKDDFNLGKLEIENAKKEFGDHFEYRLKKIQEAIKNDQMSFDPTNVGIDKLDAETKKSYDDFMKVYNEEKEKLDNRIKDYDDYKNKLQGYYNAVVVLNTHSEFSKVKPLFDEIDLLEVPKEKELEDLFDNLKIMLTRKKYEFNLIEKEIPKSKLIFETLENQLKNVLTEFGQALKDGVPLDQSFFDGFKQKYQDARKPSSEPYVFEDNKDVQNRVATLSFQIDSKILITETVWQLQQWAIQLTNTINNFDLNITNDVDMLFDESLREKIENKKNRFIKFPATKIIVENMEKLLDKTQAEYEFIIEIDNASNQKELDEIEKKLKQLFEDYKELWDDARKGNLEDLIKTKRGSFSSIKESLRQEYPFLPATFPNFTGQDKEERKLLFQRGLDLLEQKEENEARKLFLESGFDEY